MPSQIQEVRKRCANHTSNPLQKEECINGKEGWEQECILRTEKKCDYYNRAVLGLKSSQRHCKLCDAEVGPRVQYCPTCKKRRRQASGKKQYELKLVKGQSNCPFAGSVVDSKALKK